ncbi:Lrp/AsnC family transcriptional regulator [Pontixanthobacter aestiaquae]|uniref:Winged helix-turn-helix transcriptional regulator n=1 Tax=Pontixanthobacter aestiaquae TaxID=1509367 RepID=A0A844Z7C6_9SPHN|nr:Lrp/AsnC family transcriptional regulator [Pontixanthobacter aestiaquae]MDN3646299.1 Lrp/AsnC family transcriptional regulator [Pontixanthobacter aestiaquae]MXO82710.1 winged helix-turn-helix transcriptional regulator [Pontixanthobacter aestiaquae]
MLEKLDRIDYAIIGALQKNGRLTNLELAEAVGLSPSPCLRRMRKLELANIITGYSAQVDGERYGLPITVFMEIRLQSHTHDIVMGFEKAVTALDNVLDCYVVSGATDYLLRVVLADLNHYDRFLRREIQVIPGIASIDSNFAIDKIKHTTVYPRPD